MPTSTEELTDIQKEIMVFLSDASDAVKDKDKRKLLKSLNLAMTRVDRL
jgi:uncharacterized membrane protein